MKRTVFFTLLFFFMCSIHGLAQSTKWYIPKEVYEQGVDYANCKYITLALKQSRTKNVEAPFKKACNCEELSSLSFEKMENQLLTVFRGKNQSDHRALESFLRQIDSLKEQWDHSMNPETAIAYITDPQKIVGISSIYLKSTEGTDEVVESVKKQLEELFEDHKTEVKNATPHFFNSTVKTPIKSSPRIKDSDSSITLFELIVVQLLTIIITLILSRVFFRKEKFEESKKEKDGISSLHKERGNKNYAFLVSRIDKLEKSNSHITTDLTSLGEKIKFVENDLQKEKKKTASDSNSNQEAEVRQRIFSLIPEDTTETIFYASAPVQGSFLEKYSTDTYQEGRSIYQLTKKSNTVATFKVANQTASMNKAVSTAGAVVEPVSEWRNVLKANHTKIKTISPGKAELRGGKWVVTEKAVIEYV